MNTFGRQFHEKNTRGNKSVLRTPKVKTEAGRKIIAFQADLTRLLLQLGQRRPS